MDRVLDKFDINAVKEKVDSWLKKSKLSCLSSYSLPKNAQIFHFENHRMHLDSDDSFKSTDTAKYILSNRKHRTASCTTMTIKKFRYVKGKADELERKYDFLEKLAPKHNFNVSRKPNFSHKVCDGGLNYVDKNIPERRLVRVTRRRKKRSDILTKRLYSSSSSSCSSYSCTLSHEKSKFRRYRRKYQKKAHTHLPQITSSDCKELPNRNTPPRAGIFKLNANRIKVQTLQNETFLQSENIAHLQVNSGNVQCQLNTLIENNHINSKLFKKKIVVKCRKHLFENSRSPEIKVGSTSRGSARKFVVYEPENKLQHSENVTGSLFRVTEDLLEKVIGKKALLRYTTFNPQKLPLDVDSGSAVYFELPAEYESSGSCNASDEDVLNMFGKVGKVIVELTTQSHIHI